MTIVISTIAPLILLAILAEAVTEQVKDVWPYNLTARGKRLLALIVGLMLAAPLRISLFADATGSVQVVGILLAGPLCSRSANHVHDLFGLFSKLGATINSA